MSLRLKALPIVALLAFTAAFAIDPGSPGSTFGNNPKLDTVSIKPDSVWRAKPDSAPPPQDTTVQAAMDTLEPKKLYEYISHPVLQVLTLPIEYGLVPVVKFVIWPSKAPLRYFLNENVIDRTINLISFGQNDKIMLYPTMNRAPGTGSSVGLTLRHSSLFGRPNERMVSQGNLYVNGDWKFRTNAMSNDVLGTGFNTKASLGLVRVKNTSFNQPGTASFWYYADSSNIYSWSINRLIYRKVGLRGSYQFRDNQYSEAPTQPGTVENDFFKTGPGIYDPKSRGLEKKWIDHSLALQLFRDTRINENIPLSGAKWNATYHYHLTDARHNYHGWMADYTQFFKLGKEKYEISADEERKAGGLSMRKVLEKVELENLKKELFNRKALVLHGYASQVYELPGNTMPAYGLQTLGNDTPMRGYSGSRFRDYTVMSLGTEYRFPVLRLVDGVIFNEYGLYGRSWDKIDVLENLKNSWGFGIRVRRPDIYLFRLQLGFHGAQGITLNMSVDEPY